MKKVIVFVICVAMLLAVFCACANETAPTGEAENAAPAESATEAEQASSGDSEAKPSEEPAAASGSLKSLSLEDVNEIYNPDAVTDYQNSTMDSKVDAKGFDVIDLTDEEKAQIAAMNLGICLEQDHLDDAMKLVRQGVQDASDELGIEVKTMWMATDFDGASQLDDYVNIAAVADQYDAFFTVCTDSSVCSDAMLAIQEKIPCGYMCSVPYGVDWAGENFIGMTDINAREAGRQTAKAAIKVLNDCGGAIGTMGYSGDMNTTKQRYMGWEEVFSENPDITVYQEWFDNEDDTKDMCKAFLTAHPDIKVLLVDWSYKPAYNCQQAIEELGLTAGEDIYLLAIDYDNVVTIPMATDGDSSVVAAACAQDWYKCGYDMIYMYGKYLVDKGANYKFVCANPAPLATPSNVKTLFPVIVPDTCTAIPMPDEIAAVDDSTQWSLADMNLE